MSTTTRKQKTLKVLFSGFELHELGPAILSRDIEEALLHRCQIKLPRSFLIKQRAVGLVAAAPVFVAARYSEEISRSHSLLPVVVLIQVGAFDDRDPYIIGVG